MTTVHEGCSNGQGERAAVVSPISAVRPCAGRQRTGPERVRREVADPRLPELPDVDRLLARMLDEPIPLALIADLANPMGPDSVEIMASERSDVG